MESNPCTEPEHSDVQAAIRTTTTLPTGALATRTASMFTDAQVSSITGGSFRINNINIFSGPSLDGLHKRVATNAILNSGGRDYEVKCHSGTRKEVIGRIETWRDAQESLTPIFWVSGRAGAGKTAIMRTITERCKTDGVPHASFFFFRADSTRNSVSSLIATLVHQIILLYPSLRDSVATVLCTNPLILDSVLEDQLAQLIVAPLQFIRQSSSSYRLPLLIIDGLDECESENKGSQRQILEAFDKVFARTPSGPFRLLVASRDEPQIRAAFNNISSRILPLYLDNEFYPDNGIRDFVNDEFKRDRKTHPLARTLDASWLSVEDVDNIGKISSRQFIDPSTALRLVMDSSASLMLSLAISTRSPFFHLDPIYMFVPSRVKELEALKDILHAQILRQEASQRGYGKRTSFRQMELAKFVDVRNHIYAQTRIRSYLADLSSIFQRWFGHVVPYHASLDDYLLDRSRSGNYVDIDANILSQFDDQEASHPPGSTYPTQSQSPKMWTHNPADEQWKPTQQNEDNPAPSAFANTQGARVARETERVDLRARYMRPPVRHDHENPSSGRIPMNAQINEIIGGSGPAFPITVLGIQALSFATRPQYSHYNYPLAPPAVIGSPSTVWHVGLQFPSLYNEMITIGPPTLFLFINVWIHLWAIRHHRHH